MIIRVLHRFDIIGLGPDSPEDEEGIKASSEICKFLGVFRWVRYWNKKKIQFIVDIRVF